MVKFRQILACINPTRLDSLLKKRIGNKGMKFSDGLELNLPDWGEISHKILFSQPLYYKK